MSKIIRVNHKDPILRTFVLFAQLANAVYKYADSRFYHGSHLTTPKFVALTVLISNGGRMTHTELANWTGTERHNITALVDRMEEDGFSTLFNLSDTLGLKALQDPDYQQASQLRYTVGIIYAVLLISVAFVCIFKPLKNVFSAKKHAAVPENIA